MNEIVGTILTALLAALVPVIAILLKVLGQKLAAFIQAKIDNQVAEGILVRLDEAAFSAVGEVWQTMGEAIGERERHGPAQTVGRPGQCADIFRHALDDRLLLPGGSAGDGIGILYALPLFQEQHRHLAL